MHDPTQVNRQGPDVGDQYRSIVLTHSEEQAEAAEASKGAAQQRFSRPIATEIAPFETFYPAEDYHQRYYEKTGHEPYCHVLPVRTLRALGLVPASRS
jgi:peptide-methionine (S)-S-oxide reductase